MELDVDVVVELTILHVEVDGLRVHVHVRDNCTQLNFVFQVLNSNGDWLSPFLEQVLDKVDMLGRSLARRYEGSSSNKRGSMYQPFQLRRGSVRSRLELAVKSSM